MALTATNTETPTITYAMLVIFTVDAVSEEHHAGRSGHPR